MKKLFAVILSALLLFAALSAGAEGIMTADDQKLDAT